MQKGRTSVLVMPVQMRTIPQTRARGLRGIDRENERASRDAGHVDERERKGVNAEPRNGLRHDRHFDRKRILVLFQAFRVRARKTSRLRLVAQISSSFTVIQMRIAAVATTGIAHTS